MLARRLTTILPPLTLEEALETTKIHSLVGLLKPGQALAHRVHPCFCSLLFRALQSCRKQNPAAKHRITYFTACKARASPSSPIA
jgi:hypothetical protein